MTEHIVTHQPKSDNNACEQLRASAREWYKQNPPAHHLPKRTNLHLAEHGGQFSWLTISGIPHSPTIPHYDSYLVKEWVTGDEQALSEHPLMVLRGDEWYLCREGEMRPGDKIEAIVLVGVTDL